MNNLLKKSIKNRVLEQIKSGRAKMKPKWHFVLKAILVLVGIIVVGLTVVYLLSFIVFALFYTGVIFVPIFGLRGVLVFLTSLPWVLIGLVALFIILLEILVKRYSFAYRKPLIYSALGVILLVVLSSLLVTQTRFHQRAFNFLQERELPFAADFYREYGMPRIDNVHVGVIKEITADGFRLTNNRGETVEVVIFNQTRFPLGVDFQVGDTIGILGDRDNGTIQALGIRPIGAIPRQGPPPPPFWRGLPMPPR